MYETTKPWYNVILAAGESCWFSYVMTGILVAFTSGYTISYAGVSSTIAHGLNAFLDFAKPFEHQVEVHFACEFIELYTQMKCHSGHVAIGSLRRFVVVTSITVGLVLVTLVGTRLVHRTPVPAFKGGRLLLAGIAKELFEPQDWVHDDHWYLDRASAMLTRLLAFQLGQVWRVLDVKSWTLLHLKDTRLYKLEPNDHQQDRGLSQLPTRLQRVICLSFGTGKEE